MANEKRLIDVNAEIHRINVILAKMDEDAISLTLEIIRDRLQKAPTVDAVEVVRCKDCGAYNTEGFAEGFGWCAFCDRGARDDHYCSHGKRRTE